MTKTLKPADYSNYTTEQLLLSYDECVKGKNLDETISQLGGDPRKLRILFQVALSDMNGLFPNLNVPAISADPKDYINKWIHRYVKALKSTPSAKLAHQPSSAPDPALGVIVGTKLKLNEKDLQEQIRAHQMFMSAENVQGSLLEEYIAINAEPEGWIWARGETLRACDFVRPSKIITSFVQVKNRDNTENSSSLAIRNGTQIQRWFRLKTTKVSGIPVPKMMWENLNKMLGLEPSKMTEEGYQKFLRQVVESNPSIIA